MDFETFGTNWMKPDFWVRCVSFHNDDISLSVELSDNTGAYFPLAAELFEWLAEQRGIIAHNAGYETGVLYALTGQEVTPRACTYALLGALANEGSPGQSWGLKQAAPELIGWEKWDGAVKGDRARMALLPFQDLGTYNQLDSAATWELYKICCSCVDDHMATWGQHFWDFHREEMMLLVSLQNEAYREGLSIDVEYLPKLVVDIDAKVDRTLKAFYEHPDIKPHLEAYNLEVVRQAEVELAARTDGLTKKGVPSVNYQKAAAKLEEMRTQTHFNPNSPADLRWLVYDRQQVEVKFYTDGGLPATDADALAQVGVTGRLLLEHRDVVSQERFLLSIQDNLDDEKVRISVKVPGTTTGRCSAGGLD